MSYSRHEVAVELLSFYEFLLGMNLPADVLKRHPREGWRNISIERLDFPKKDDVVIDLLTRIPYIRRDNEDGYQIYDSTICNDFLRKMSKKLPLCITTETSLNQWQNTRETNFLNLTSLHLLGEHREIAVGFSFATPEMAHWS